MKCPVCNAPLGGKFNPFARAFRRELWGDILCHWCATWAIRLVRGRWSR